MSLTEPSTTQKSKIPIRCWKSLYMKLTSVKVRYQNSDIESELDDCAEHFKKGIFQFSSLVSSNYVELRENKISTFMESFYQRLSKILHVDLTNCKEIFANYLLYNCNNSGTLLQERLEKNIRAVLVSTWSFHAQEKIFFLKCYYHVISSYLDKKSPYSKVFEKFVSKIPVRERYLSLLKQYNSLIHLELPSGNSFGSLADVLVPLWITYNLREQLELLQLIILMTSQIEIKMEDVDQLIELLQITSFGKYQCFFYHHSHLSNNQRILQEQIHCAITLYAIKILSIGWTQNIYESDSSKFAIHNKIMYPSNYDAKQGPIVIAWILVLYHRLMNSSSYDEQLSNQSFILLDEDLWKVIADGLSSSMMDMNVICKVLEPVIDEIVYLMFTKFGTCAFKSQLSLASIISFFCKFHVSPFNKSTTAVLTHFQERFPLNCACTFKILGAILNWSTDIVQRKEIMESLNRLPFSFKKEDCVLKTVELNKYVLERNMTPLKYFQNNVIPRGTVAIPDFEDNIVTLKKSLPIWDIMRNFLTMYLNGYDDIDLIITIIEIVNFVEISLQKIRIIDDDILRFSELVVHVIWKTSSSCNSLEEMNLLAACIKLHSVLFCIMPEDIIKCFEIYNFLPSYPVRMKRRDIHLYDTYYTESRIYTIVCCKEAKIGSYSILSSYLNFFHKVVQNILESWYTVAGLKFVLHVYNNVNNDFWKFENVDDRNLIIWNCIEIIHEILNHGLKDLFDKRNVDELIDFRDNENENVLPTTYFITKSCVTSILNSVNEGTVLSTAIIGDIGLLESVIENACWTKGKSAIMINIITYSLSLIQRCLIFVDIEKKLKKTEISLDHLFQPDKCLALLSYRYNCFSDTICLLAIKLLIKLASIKENCMFSWLQYSNELLQKEFLYPLYSNNESNAVKSSLLSLMAVCILKQIVIADALLEIDKVRKICVEKSTPNKKWQNLLLFTSRYVHEIERKPETYLTNMHCAVLNVIYACWEKKLRVPQQYYKMSENFWKFLFLPFHKNPCDNSFVGYGFILETICLEIVDSKTIDSNLKNELQSFLNSENFPRWTKFCAAVIDEPPQLSVEFETIPISISSVADSWKKFIQVVTRHCNDLIEKPGITAYPILENLTLELSTTENNKKEKFLCDIYRTYLTTWKSECSDTKWKDELILVSKMFIVLNEHHFQYSSYFNSALLEIGYKILKFGKDHLKMLNELKDKSDFLLACGEILNRKLQSYGQLIATKNEPSLEYPPLLVHLCVFTNIINGLDISTELITFVLRETDFVHFMLKTSIAVLKINSGTNTAKMLLQFQNFIFEKYPFLKKNYYCNESILNIFQSIFPSELVNEKVLTDMFTDSDKNNLFKYALNFISNLTNEPTCESKNLLIEFHTKNKQYLYGILKMINVSIKKENLCLIIAVVTLYFRISQHLYCCRYSEINDLIESMFLLFNCIKSAISTLIQPSKMCSLLLNLPLHHLQQFFEDAENIKSIVSVISETNENLMYLVKIGIQALSAFCIQIESTLCGTWPPEDWNFRWLSRIKSKSECSFPLLLLDMDNVHDDFTILSGFITLQHRAYTKRMKIDAPSPENLISNRITILSYDKTGETLLDLSYFLFSQSAMYLLHPQVDQSKKLFFVNHIFVNLKEFIRNALNDSLTEEIMLSSVIDDYDTFKRRRLDSEGEIEKLVLKTDDCQGSSVETSTPIPTRQVLSLRGDVKSSKSSSNEANKSDSARNITDTEKYNEKLHTATLQTVAALFYKLITTFKHS